MKTFYSKAEIKRIRTIIPIQRLIVYILKIPSIFRVKGSDSFQCPNCQNMNTIIFQNKNIACCPHCDRSFNPIDIVMAHKNIGFKQAVDYLDKLNNMHP